MDDEMCGSMLKVTARSQGMATIRVTAEANGVSQTHTLTVEVDPNAVFVPSTSNNSSPVAEGTIADTTFTQKTSSIRFVVSRYFSDPDPADSILTYTAGLSRAGIVDTSITDSTLTLTAVSKDTVTVTVTATDQGGLSVTQSFQATIANIPPRLADNWRRSTWNNYSDHNVMQVQGLDTGYHGVSPPHLSLPNIQVESNHQSVNRIHSFIAGNIYHLHASIILRTPDEIGNFFTASYYNRNIFFIADEKNPYLIDLNSVLSLPPQPPLIGTFLHRMTYRGNSNNAAIEKRGERRSVVWRDLHKSEDSTNPTPSDNKLFIQPFVFEQPLQDTTLTTTTVREPYIKNQARGAGVDVKMLEFDNLPWYDNRENTLNNEYSFSTVAFIKALAGNDSIPDFVKSNRIPPQSSPLLYWQYYTWQHDTSTVDVFAVRHAQQFFTHYPDPDSSLIVVSEADSAIFYMPGDQNFGFVRLVKSDTSDEWSIDNLYYANLVSGTLPSPEPLTVNISGPDCIDSENSTGRFVASPSGGVSPYSYSWSSYRICDGARGPQCNAWNGDVGVTQAVDYGGYGGDDFKIRVRVTDSSSPRQFVTSGELQVRILSSTEGSCSDDELGKMESDAETLASDADLLEGEQSIPETYALRQNFPNPFNPSTEILFDLPEDAMVSLVVYDVLGREVARLVQQELRAGTHRAQFDAGNLPSGIYFYRIQAGDFSHIHRMVLLN